MLCFNSFISLGTACKTRHQLDRVLRLRDGNYQPVKCYFDWLWGPGLAGVVKVLEKKFEILDSDLVVERMAGTVQVRDQSTGYYYLHDFSFSDGAQLDLNLAQAEMLTQLPRFKEKYAYLGAKTRDFIGNGEGNCFVYFGRIDRQLFEMFSDAVRRMSSHTPVLLNIIAVEDLDGYRDLVGSDSNWIVRTVDDSVVNGTEREWMGDDIAWDKLLSEFVLK